MGSRARAEEPTARVGTRATLQEYRRSTQESRVLCESNEEAPRKRLGDNSSTYLSVYKTFIKIQLRNLEMCCYF